MAALALSWGICAFLAFCVALIPCLGWLNWLNIPFAAAGFVVAVVALARAPRGQSPAMAITGLVLSTLAAGVGLVRLVLGGGVL